MPAGTDHHREKPTERRSSDYRKGESANRAHSGARPHSSGSDQGRPSITEQLTAAAQQQGTSGSRPHSSQQGHSGPSITEQLTHAAQQGQSSHQSSEHQGAPRTDADQGSWTGFNQGSPHFGGQTGNATGQPSAGASGAGSGSGCLPKLLLPVVIIVAFIAVIGGFGGNLLDLGGSGGTGTSSGGNYSSSPGANGTYSISPNLGAGNANDTWTVLMYVCGSNLESASTRMGGGLATSNLVELTQANLGNNVNYIIETGGAQRWQNDVVSARYLERYAMEGGYMVQKQRVNSASMAESSTLADFLKWGVSNYPANHYMLVIWDHGGGSITGVCNDDLYPYDSNGQSDSLTLPEMRDALKESGTSFEVVGFDTCLMATLETAEMLSPYSKYMVASEETEPGTGWDYTAWPAWLAQHTGTSGADLGTVVCQTYYNKCANVGAASTATLSTIDLSKIKTVSAAFENASDDIALATVDTSSLRKLYQGAGKSESYGNDGMMSMNMVDLADLMGKTRDVVGADADKVVSAIDDAVVFEAHGRNRGQASGLSVFYPLQRTDTNDFYKYAEITSNTPYLQFLGVMYGVYDKYDWTKFSNYVSLRGEPVNESKIGIAYEQSVDSDGHVHLQITQGADQVAQVELQFYVSLNELGLLSLLGSDNDLHGSYETGQFVDNFQNDWIAIDGNFVSATLTEQGNGYNLYLVPITLNGERTNLLLEYDYSTNEFGVLCAWDENEVSTGMAGLTGRTLKEGDEIQFLFPTTNTSTEEQSFIPLGTMSWHEDPKITYEYMGDGTYGFRYAITDVLGNVQLTDLVFERYENGKYVG